MHTPIHDDPAAVTPSPEAHEHEEARVVGEFLDAYLRDTEAQRAHPLDHYQTLFPGHESAIAREFKRLSNFDTGRFPRAFGPFLLQGIIGEGGQAIVYRARDTRLGREVALKVLEVVGPEAHDAMQRLQREAALASQLDHPAICTVLESGVHDRRPYIAMRRVEGESLAARVFRWKQDRDRGGRRETISIASSRVRELLRLFVSVARGLEAAHSAGVVHRDIKPANIMINRQEQPVIVDFGLARLTEGGLPSVTRGGDVMGTPCYMAPERFDDPPPPCDVVGDIWALGVSLYEALTLSRPFEAPTRDDSVRALRTREPTDPRRLNPAIGRDLSVVLQTLLRKDPGRRYQTASIVADELQAVLDGRPVRARRPMFIGRIVRWAARQPAAAAAVASMCLTCAALSGWYGYYTATREDVATIAAQRERAQVERHLANGFIEILSLDGTRALPHLRRALALDPQSAEAIGGLALLLARTGDHAGAVRLLEGSPNVLARHPVLRATLAWCRKERDGLAVTATPVDSDAILHAEDHFLLVVTHLLTPPRFKDHQNAADAYASARLAMIRNLRPRPLYHFVAAMTASHAGKRQDARAIGLAAGHLWPDSAMARYALARALIHDSLSTPEECLRARSLLDSVRDRLSGPRFHHDLGVLHSRLGQMGLAERAFRAGIAQADPAGNTHEALLSCLRRSGQLEQAVREGREAMARYEGNAALACQVAFALAELGRNDEAETLLRATGKRLPHSRKATLTLAEILTAAGRPEEGLALTEPLKRRLPDPDARFVRARALQYLERHEEAELELRLALQEAPNPLGFVAHAISLARTGRIKEASRRFDRAAATRDPKLLLECAESYLIEGAVVPELEPGRAIGWVRRALELGGGVKARALLANALFSNGDVDEAIDAMTEVVKELEAQDAPREQIRLARHRLRIFRRDRGGLHGPPSP